MRPVHHQAAHTSTHPRSGSTTPTHYSASAAPIANLGQKTSERMNRAGSDRGASTSTSRKVKQGKAQQNVPGLITLSKPLNHEGDEGSSTENKTTRAKVDSNGSRQSQRQKKGRQMELKEQVDDESLLSRSLPNEAKNADPGWQMPVNTNPTSTTLNWQQQLNGNTPAAATTTPEKSKKVSRAHKSKAAAASPAPMSAHAAPASDKQGALTWQQELLGSSKPRGPTFDVFADARDELTFGGGGGGSGGEGSKSTKEARAKKQKSKVTGRARAGSVGEIVTKDSYSKAAQSAGLPNKPASSYPIPQQDPVKHDASLPTTPSGKIAYAGPNFHNSPPPASLPLPKFLQQRNSGLHGDNGTKSSLFAREAKRHQSSADSGDVSLVGDDSSSSSEELQEERRHRGATAPPELSQGNRQSAEAESDRSVTIESLLARMMQPSGGG